MKCTDISGTNAIEFFNYYSSQETGKEGEQRTKYKTQMRINNAYAMQLREESAF